MTVPILGVVISSVFVGALSLLFRHEKKRGARFLPGVRSFLDDLVYRFEAFRLRCAEYIGGDIFRQVAHYIFHQTLTVVLNFLRRVETRVQSALRRNISFAHKLDGAKRERNKLDEIAEHKLSVALSDEEKKAHKEKSLEG